MTVAGLDVREIPLAKLARAEWNANRVPDETLAKVRRSVEQFGVVENLVVRPHPEQRGKFEVLSGNHRLSLYAELGLPSAPCHVVKLDDGRARILAQVLNRTRGEDDPDAYRALMTTVLAQVERDEILALLPETERSLRQLEEETRALMAGEGGDDGDAVPDPPKDAKSKRGEVYELGRHRLMCGDARDSKQMAGLVRDAEVQAVWTDPPYGVEYVGKTADGLTIQNDGSEGLPSLLRAAFAAVDSVLVPGGRFYCAAPPGQRELEFRVAIEAVGWRIHQTLVWVKDVFVLGHSDYHYQHEPILYGYKPGKGRVGRGNHAGSRWYGDDSQSSVFSVPRPKRSADHPTMKPVELIAAHLTNSTRADDCVLDPFGGSGSTLIACEQTGRRALLMEIDPAYCDVIRRRYADHVGRPDLAP